MSNNFALQCSLPGLLSLPPPCLSATSCPQGHPQTRLFSRPCCSQSSGTPNHCRPWVVEQESWVRPQAPFSTNVHSRLLWWQDGQHSRFSFRQPRLPLCFQYRPTAWGAVSSHTEPRRGPPALPVPLPGHIPNTAKLKLFSLSLRRDCLPLPHPFVSGISHQGRRDL